MSKTKQHFSQKTMTKTKSKFVVKINTATWSLVISLDEHFAFTSLCIAIIINRLLLLLCYYHFNH